jgi:hypothetical protein
MKNYTDQIKTARARGCPLVLLTCSDPSETIRRTLAGLNGKIDDTPAMVWDCVRGLNGINQPGQDAARSINQDGDPAMITGNVVECLRLLQQAPEGSLVFMHNAQAWLADAIPAQACWNLRDAWKANGCTLVMLALPGTKPHPALKDDIITVDAALPTPEELAAIRDSILDDAGIDRTTIDALTNARAVDATLGLSAFGAEQVLAMSLTRTGLDTAELWSRKRTMIQQTPGLECYAGPDRFEDIGGCDNVKKFLQALLAGKRAPRCIVFLDEIEKALAGTRGDTSGTAQGTHGELLKYMQDTDTAGLIFIGPPGAAKSAVAKATGNAGNIPLVQLDLKGLEGSLVGESLKNLKSALATVSAIAQGRALFIATCNSFGELSPELKRRFKLGIFFFDLPTAEERAQIWKIYRAKYQRPAGEQQPPDDGWTGAEIKNACDIADRLGITLTDAASYIVPVARSAADMIRKLRQDASGKFISASAPGVYQYNETATSASIAPARKIRKEE